MSEDSSWVGDTMLAILHRCKIAKMLPDVSGILRLIWNFLPQPLSIEMFRVYGFGGLRFWVW